MKIRVTFTIELDPDMWSAVYGVNGRIDVRTDVKDWAADTLHDQIVASLGVHSTEVTVTQS